MSREPIPALPADILAQTEIDFPEGEIETTKSGNKFRTRVNEMRLFDQSDNRIATFKLYDTWGSKYWYGNLHGTTEKWPPKDHGERVYHNLSFLSTREVAEFVHGQAWRCCCGILKRIETSSTTILVEGSV